MKRFRIGAPAGRIANLAAKATTLSILTALALLGSSPPATADSDGRDGIGDSPSSISDSLAFELLRMMAREDTAGLGEIDYIFGEFVDVEDRRPTLREIIGWCIEREKNRFAGVEDVQFRNRFRSIEFYGDPEDDEARRVLTEGLEQVYLRPPDQMVRIGLGERTWDSDEAETDEDLETEVESIQGDLGNLPVFFEVLDDYDFSILERRLFTDRILYKIAFQPRGAFASLPEGWFLVDTGDYQILRAEYHWTKNVPYPVFLKSIDRVSVRRSKAQGIWMIENAQMEMTLRRIPFAPIPRRIEFELTVESLAVNQGIPDSVWTRP